jgi:hypothetical protein
MMHVVVDGGGKGIRHVVMDGGGKGVRVVKEVSVIATRTL